MAKGLRTPSGENNLIVSLATADRETLLPHMQSVKLEHAEILSEPGERIKMVYFPTSGIGSVIALDSKDRRIEAGLFGRDGMSGTALLLGDGISPHKTLVQVAGAALAIDADRLSDLLDRHRGIRTMLLNYAQTLLTQASHTALSNGQSKLEERLARWLLMCHDRIDGDGMALTHEFLSVMLGVRRAGVTVSTHVLEGRGLIRSERGRITVIDREGLEDEATGSYGVPEAEYERLIGNGRERQG